MKISLSALSLILVAALAVILSCGRSVDPEPQPPDELVDLQNQLAESPRDNEEAELMAMWLGREVAHTRDYDKIRTALSVLRDNYRSSVPQLDSIEFSYFNEVGRIFVFLTASAVTQLRTGVYADWDSLNTLYRMTDMDTIRIWNSGEVSLSFEGRLKPELMGAIYGSLPSIWHYGINLRGGDWSNLYPWPEGNAMTFLLRRADGDCPAGCINSHFWYFRVTEGHAEYVGDFEVEDGIPFPDWWDVAKSGFCHYFSYFHGYCSGI